MIDLPANGAESPKIHMEQIVKDVSKMMEKSYSGFKIKQQVSKDVNDPIYLEAVSVVNSLSEGFHFKTVIEVIKSGYILVKQAQGYTLDEQKDHLTKIINYIIDITDTPYLPDYYTDPILKALVPPLIDIVIQGHDSGFQLIPVLNRNKPTGETFKQFVSRLEGTYSDGFQWSDIAVYLKETVCFVAGFSFLSVDQKKQGSIEILNMIIESTTIPGIPNAISTPILQSFTAPVVELVFNRLI